MAKGFKSGVTGGVPLNFKVVGGTSAPSNPKENTIWINTDAEITSWIFSKTQPSPETEGMVWISTGTISAVGFNALKKNGIMVYPLTAKQYINGTWAAKTAMSYRGGQWVEWIAYLYNKGVEYVDENGDSWVGSGTYQKGNNYLVAGMTSTAAAYSGSWTSPFFDVTNLTAVEVYVDTYHRGGSSSFGTIEVIDASGAIVASTSFSDSKSNIWVSLDVSRITSNCKVRVTSGHTKESSGQMAYIKFSIVRCY